QPLANGSPPPGPLQEDKVEPDGKRNSSQNVQLQVQAVLNESLPIPPGDNWKQKRLHPHKRTERYDYIDNIRCHTSQQMWPPVYVAICECNRLDGIIHCQTPETLCCSSTIKSGCPRPFTVAATSS